MTESTAAQSSPRFRFGLLDLLLITALLAAWISAFQSTSRAERLSEQVKSMRISSDRLRIQDLSRLHIKRLMSLSYETKIWKIYVPSVDQAGEFSLVFATEEITNAGLPDTELQTLPLAPGEHLIEVKKQIRSDSESRFLVTVDDQEVIKKTHPAGWHLGGGSSEYGTRELGTWVAPSNELANLLRSRTMQAMSANSWTSTPPEVPVNGTFLGIIPTAKLKATERTSNGLD